MAVAIPLGLLMFYSHRLEKETERFDQSRPILQTMRQASLGQPTVYPPPAVKVLLTALPTGTGAPTATLETEGFSCKNTIPSVAPGATKKMQADESAAWVCLFHCR